MSMFSNLYSNTHNKVEIIGDTQTSSMTTELFSKNRKTSCVEIVNKKVMLKADAFPARKQNIGNLFYKGGKGVVTKGNGVAVRNNCGGNANADLPYGSHIDVSWLPFAAGHYCISPNINDYVVAVIPALTSDIPNRNMQGFMTTTLFEFDVEHGCQRYKTFIGRPICQDHNNKDLSLAQGVIIDAFIVPVPKYKVVKVMCLALIDRTKCILLKRYKEYKYSMGCLASAFVCSVCSTNGHVGLLGPGVRRTCTCYQSNYTDLRSYGGIYDGRLHFIMAVDPIFGELSILSTAPADFSAVGEIIS